MKLVFTKGFLDELANLPPQIRKQTLKALEHLVLNLEYPSLHAKRMQGYSGIWEARISRGYRFTFMIEEETYVLRRVGKHDVERNP